MRISRPQPRSIGLWQTSVSVCSGPRPLGRRRGRRSTWTQSARRSARTRMLPNTPDACGSCRRGSLSIGPTQDTPERSHFEVRRAEIRWYVENLMTAELPGEQEKALLRHQYEDLANHATESLIAQFSFLDPNRVQKAKADHLADYCRNLDAPLLPIFLMSLSETQVEQIKQRGATCAMSVSICGVPWVAMELQRYKIRRLPACRRSRRTSILITCSPGKAWTSCGGSLVLDSRSSRLLPRRGGQHGRCGQATR